MAHTKSEVLTIRITPQVKALLRLAAAREHRSLALLIEVMVLSDAGTHGLTGPYFISSHPLTRLTKSVEPKDPE